MGWGYQVGFPGNRLINFSSKQFLVMSVKWSAWEWSYREGSMVSTFVILSENLGLVPSTLIKVQKLPVITVLKGLIPFSGL